MKTVAKYLHKDDERGGMGIHGVRGNTHYFLEKREMRPDEEAPKGFVK